MKHQDYTVAVCNINVYLSTTNIGHRQHTNINVNLLLLVSYKASIAKFFFVTCIEALVIWNWKQLLKNNLVYYFCWWSSLLNYNYWSGWNRLYISIGVGHRNHISEKLHQACKDQHWTVITLHACPLGRFCADQFLFLASKNLDRWDNNRRFIYIIKTGKKSFHTKLILHWQWVNSEG